MLIELNYCSDASLLSACITLLRPKKKKNEFVHIQIQPIIELSYTLTIQSAYHLHKHKLPIRITQQRFHNRVQNILHTRPLHHTNSLPYNPKSHPLDKLHRKFAIWIKIRTQSHCSDTMQKMLCDYDLDTVIWSNIVLINSLQPSDVVVGMRNQMNVQFALHNAGSSVVLHVSATDCSNGTKQKRSA